MKALVTGATGFIGARLVETLRRRGDDIAVIVRPGHPLSRSLDTGVRVYRADLTAPETLKGVCVDAEVVFHLAGYAHADDADEPSATEIHQKVTVEGTRALLHESRRSRVKRFVFASSVKAMGEGDPTCLDEKTSAHPTTAYGQAKRAAEELVIATGETGMEICILRLPLVYGNSSKGNIARMMIAIDRHRFPPLSRIPNKRSMVHVEDVVQALLLVAERKEAAGKTYIVTDGKAYSTYDIYSAICRAFGRETSRWSVPLGMLKLGAKVGDVVAMLRRKSFPLNSSTLEKLTGSAWYSSDKLCRELGFQPRQTFETALPEMIAHYRQHRIDAA